MKTLREYVDQLDEISRADEGIKSKLAGAALAGALAMNPAQAQEAPTWQSQVKAAMLRGEIPQANKVSFKQDKDGWVTSVTIDGQTYDLSQRIPQQKAQLASWKDEIRTAMMREEELEEASTDAVQRIEQLVRYK